MRMDTPKEITSYFACGFLNNSHVSFSPPAKGLGWKHPHQLHCLLGCLRYLLGDQKVTQRGN